MAIEKANSNSKNENNKTVQSVRKSQMTVA